MRSIKNQFLIMLIAASLVPLIITVAIVIADARKQTQTQFRGQLTTLAHIKQHGLDAVLNQIAQGSHAVVRNRSLIEALETYEQAEEMPPEAFAELDSYGHAHHVVRNYQESAWGSLHHIFVVDTTGRVVLSPPHGDSNKSHLGHDVTHASLPAALAGEPQITDFFGFSEATHYHQLYMDPIKDDDGRVLGALVSEVVIQNQLEILNRDFQLGETGKVWMTTLDGEQIVNDKSEVQPPLVHQGITDAIAQGLVVENHIDHSGTPVLGAYLHDEHYPWVLGLEIDQAEVNAASSRVMYIMIAAVLVVGGLMLVIGHLLARRFTGPIRMLADRLKDIAAGEADLTKRVDVKSRNELGDLGKWFNTFVEKIHGVISEVGTTAQEVAGASTQIAASSEEMAKGIDDQNQQVAQISTAVEEMSSSIIEVARKSGEAADNAQASGKVAEQGGLVVAETIHGMSQISDAVSASAESVSELGKRGDQIGQIINVINDIADQTNLLALNAAIEAARAGEHGRGFAVVADEVRKLADRTTKATEEIGESITAIQTETDQAVQRMNAGTEQVQVGVEKATQAGQSLEQIVAGAQEVSTMIQSIAAAAEQQSTAGEEVSRGVQAVSAMTSQSAEGANQASQAASQLSIKAERLQVLVGRFKL